MTPSARKGRELIGECADGAEGNTLKNRVIDFGLGGFGDDHCSTTVRAKARADRSDLGPCTAQRTLFNPSNPNHRCCCHLPTALRDTDGKAAWIWETGTNTAARGLFAASCDQQTGDRRPKTKACDVRPLVEPEPIPGIVRQRKCSVRGLGV